MRLDGNKCRRPSAFQPTLNKVVYTGLLAEVKTVDSRGVELLAERIRMHCVRAG
jgi:hypothetical protein